jgi:hypothetical protein
MVKDVDFWSHTLVLQVRGEMPEVRGVRGGNPWEPEVFHMAVLARI